MTVPLPTPLGPDTTKSRPVTAGAVPPGSGGEEVEQLAALAIREPADRLRLADPALRQKPGRLDPAQPRDGHEDVVDLGGQNLFGWLGDDIVDSQPRPAFRSRFSCARLTLIWFARLSASIR